MVGNLDRCYLTKLHLMSRLLICYFVRFAPFAVPSFCHFDSFHMSVTLQRVGRRAAAGSLPLICTCALPAPPRLAAHAASRTRPSSSLASRRIGHRASAARSPIPSRSFVNVLKPEHGPTAAYDVQVDAGLIVNDEHQRDIVALLQRMYDELQAYDAPPVGPLPPPTKPSLLSRISRSRWFAMMDDELHQANTAMIPLPHPPTNKPKGLYLFGSVGCGKSFLMDLFYANLPPKYDSAKRRVHFHAFMMDVHKRGHRIKAKKGQAQDWIVLVARELAREVRVLCFDEFQVTGARHGPLLDAMRSSH